MRASVEDWATLWLVLLRKRALLGALNEGQFAAMFIVPRLEETWSAVSGLCPIEWCTRGHLGHRGEAIEFCTVHQMTMEPWDQGPRTEADQGTLGRDRRFNVVGMSFGTCRAELVSCLFAHARTGFVQYEYREAHSSNAQGTLR